MFFVTRKIQAGVLLKAILGSALLGFFSACNNHQQMPLQDVHGTTSSSQGPTNSPTSAATGPTYKFEISSIIQKNCLPCHGPGTGHDWTDYNTFKSEKAKIEIRVLGANPNMPLGGKLSDGDKATLQSWIDAGMPYDLGNASASNPPSSSPGQAPDPLPNPTPLPPPGPTPPPTESPFFRPDILSLVQRNCIACHGPSTQHNWTDYATFKAAKDKILIRVLGPNPNMPMGAVLADSDKKLLQLWIDQGMQEVAVNPGPSPNPAPAPGPLPGPTPDPAPAPNPFPNAPGLVQNCLACHGDKGQSSNPMFPVLAGQSKNYIVTQLKAFLEKTRSDEDAKNFMWPVVEPLAESDFHAIAVYFTSQSPVVGKDPDHPLDPVKVAEGQSIYFNGPPDHHVAACVACHGTQAEGRDLVPRLGGQFSGYLSKQLHAMKNNERPQNPTMVETAKGLTDEQIESVSQFLNSLGDSK
jgi:cytochrome c553